MHGFGPWGANPCMHNKQLANPSAEAALAADLFKASPSRNFLAALAAKNSQKINDVLPFGAFPQLDDEPS